MGVVQPDALGLVLESALDHTQIIIFRVVKGPYFGKHQGRALPIRPRGQRRAHELFLSHVFLVEALEGESNRLADLLGLAPEELFPSVRAEGEGVLMVVRLVT
eukprot:4268624-Heterocapsa_arctica.AAC.1